MDNLISNPSEENFNKVREHTEDVRKRLRVFLYLFFMFVVAAFSLWFMTNKFFDWLTVELLSRGVTVDKNIKDLWNIQMNFVPFIFLSLSAGCLAVYIVFGLLNSLSFALDFVLFKWKRNNNGGGKDEN
jgi:Sec-independent protein secretion pathway component TatC